MSNFLKSTPHPTKGKIITAEWLDDYYGRHVYGVRFTGEDKVYHEDEIPDHVGQGPPLRPQHNPKDSLEMANVLWFRAELANLLARIHRDGGEYLAKHGWEKACRDADEIVASRPDDEPTPWHKRANDLEEKEGPYCDYAAWQEWAAKEWPLEDFETVDTIELVGWYGICCKLASARPAEPSDDNEPITEEWMESVGFRWRRTTAPEVRLPRAWWTIRWNEVHEQWQLYASGLRNQLSTRGDARRLCAALGVTLEEE